MSNYNRADVNAIDGILAAIPFAGDGLNTGLLTAAHALRRAKVAEERAFDLLYPIACDRRGKDRRAEVTLQVSTAYDRSFVAAGTQYRASDYKQPLSKIAHEPDLWRRSRIEEQSLYDLWESSPIRLEGECCTEEVIDTLFPGDPLLCVGYSTYDFTTNRRSALRGRLGEMALIVPSPAATQTALTLDGKESHHAKAQFAKRKYLVVEFDSVPNKDVQASIILFMAKHWPLRLVVDSAGKSLHAWFYVEGIDETQLEGHFRSAIRLGADPRTFLISQFVRMPDGLRDNHKRQRTMYYQIEK